MSNLFRQIKDLFRRNAKASLDPRIPLEERSIEELIAEWEGFYQDTFGIKTDFSNLQIPEKESGFNRLIIMAGGMTPQRLYDKCGEFFPCWKWTSDSLDNVVTYSERTSKNSAYAIWVRDCVEADEEFKKLSADKIKAKNINTETLEEYFIHGLKYFRESRKHLDIRSVTVCAGSRLSDGTVPCVSGSGREVRIHPFPPGRSDGIHRSRRVVS